MATDLIGPLLAGASAEAAAALSPSAKRVMISPGSEVAWDECCEGGQVWSRLISVSPIAGRPGATGVCNIVGYVATIAVGVLRCAASLDSRGNPPTAKQVTQDAQQMTADSANLAEAILCHLAPRTFGDWTPLGAMGGCVGGEWTYTKHVNVCACPPNTGA